MSKLVLYHGTTQYFNNIDLRYCKFNKDFGRGFYTTADINQALDFVMINRFGRTSAFLIRKCTGVTK